jgi:uncharacterized membrane protein
MDDGARYLPSVTSATWVRSFAPLRMTRTNVSRWKTIGGACSVRLPLVGLRSKTSLNRYSVETLGYDLSMPKKMLGTAQAECQARGRRLYTLAAFFSLAGLADAIYLTVEHLTGETAVCVVTKGCAEVLGSKYAAIGKVPLAALGALAYFTAFSLATLAAFGYRRAAIFLMLLVQGMFAVTLWLLLVQAFVLHAFCDYCLLSAALTLLLLGAAFAAYLFTNRSKGQ